MIINFINQRGKYNSVYVLNKILYESCICSLTTNLITELTRTIKWMLKCLRNWLKRLIQLEIIQSSIAKNIVELTSQQKQLFETQKKVEESLRELKEMARQSRKSNLLKLQSDFPVFYRALDDFEWEYNKLLHSINDFNFKKNLWRSPIWSGTPSEEALKLKDDNRVCSGELCHEVKDETSSTAETSKKSFPPVSLKAPVMPTIPTGLSNNWYWKKSYCYRWWGWSNSSKWKQIYSQKNDLWYNWQISKNEFRIWKKYYF